MSEALYDLRDVTFRFEEVTALDRLTLTIAAGKRVALLGANGSGKSTLLRLLDGLCFPESGAVRFDGQELSEARLEDRDIEMGFRRRVAFVFQNPDVQLFNPTVFDEVAFGPLQLQWPRERVLEKVEAALESLGLQELRDRAPHRLSGGEKKRVALASVLVADPDVLLLDEPTASLDPRSQSWMIDFLVGCAGTKTVVAATHDLEILEDIADHCVVLESGAVVAQGAPRPLLEDVALLQRTGLIHVHRHVHESGVVHAHPHLHRAHRHGA